MYILIYETNNYLKICVLYSVFLCRTYRGKGKDKTPLHNKRKDLSIQRISILGSMDYKPNTPGNHDIPFGVP